MFVDPVEPLLGSHHCCHSNRGVSCLRLPTQPKLDLYELGHGITFDRAVQEANVGGLARHMARTSLESGARRTFVKRAVQLLQQQADGERALTPDELGALDGGAGGGLGGGDLEGEEDIF